MVPFEQIGEGQVGRLAYQVIGQDGPIFNPQNIRYMAPEEVGLTPGAGVDSSGLSAGLAGVNLISSFATLAVSVAVLREVRRLSDKLAEIRSLTVDTHDKLDRISAKLNIINVKVSEQNLREALKHVGQTAIQDGQIDLREIKKLESDLAGFWTGVEDLGYCSDTAFTLSSDVRDRLRSLHSFLFSLRELVARRHNAKAGGDPLRTFTMHPVYDYTPVHSAYRVHPLAIKNAFRESVELQEVMKASINEKFFFSSEEDQEHFAHIAGQSLMRVFQRFVNDDQFSWPMYRGLGESINEGTDWDQVIDMTGKWELNWLLQTDMGLVFRSWRELEALGDYRHPTKGFYHWERMDPRPLGQNEFLVNCRWKK